MFLVLGILQFIICVVLIFLVLLHSGKDAGLSGAFGIGGGGSSVGGGSMVEKNLDRATIFFGIDETEEEGRYRQAACLLADISWRAHPDYRGLQALNIIAHGTFTGISHPGRAFIALANYYRFEGLRDDGATGALATVATPRLLERAKLLGGLLRVVYLFSASMPGIARNLRFETAKSPDLDLEFVVPPDYREFQGERIDGRLQQLAKLTGKRLAFRFE